MGLLFQFKQMSETIILGVDPGTQVTGFGVVRLKGGRIEAVDFGCIRPPPSKRLTERYEIIFKGLNYLIETYLPNAVAVETQFIQKNVQSGLKLGMARGVAILAATLHQIEVFEYTPSRAKKSVAGNGRATKKQVQAMVQRLLFLSSLPEPEDAADALSLAICHAHTMQLQEHGQYII